MRNDEAAQVATASWGLGGMKGRMQRLRLQPDERLDFLRGFLREPQQVASVVPSSRFLERRIVALAEVARCATVAELGPGTGGTTRAILRALPAASRLLSIEINPHFAAALRIRCSDTRLVVHEGSATDLDAILARYALPRPDAVLSGIPFSTVGRGLGLEIVQTIHRTLVPGGRFVAYQMRDRVGELGQSVFGRPQVVWEFRNIPPLRIFCWKKPRSEAKPD